MIRFVFIAAIVFIGCTEPAAPETHVVEQFSSGITKKEYTYAGQDSLNREEVEYHPSGELYIRGQVVEGNRHGEWRSWHENGSIWSLQEYQNGIRQGINKVWFENGQLRYSGTFENDEKSGTWTFYSEKGDTLTHRNF